MSKLLYGVGDVCGLPTRIDKQTMRPEYTLWSNMLSRCYGEKTQSRQPTYVGCTVSENFKSFKFFIEWCEQQKGYGNKNWALDKDLLVKGNTHYSEDTCVFLPRLINQVITPCTKRKSNLPIGVNYTNGVDDSKGYLSVIRCYGKYVRLLKSDDMEECMKVYAYKKSEYIKELAEIYKQELDYRAYNALISYEVY